MEDIPLLIDFAAPSSIFRERNRISTLRIVGNGPPGTFVHFPERPQGVAADRPGRLRR